MTLFCLLLFVLCCPVLAQGRDAQTAPGVRKDSLAASPVPDSSKPAQIAPVGALSLPPATATDTALKSANSDTGALQKPDSLSTTQSSVLKKPDTLSRALAANDSAAAAQQQRKLKLVKRSHTSRQQVVLAASMMVFVISIMTLAQQWNPR